MWLPVVKVGGAEDDTPSPCDCMACPNFRDPVPLTGDTGATGEDFGNVGGATFAGGTGGGMTGRLVGLFRLAGAGTEGCEGDTAAGTAVDLGKTGGGPAVLEAGFGDGEDCFTGIWDCFTGICDCFTGI